MYKMNSVSGLLLYVDTLENTLEFYEKLGFQCERTVEGCAKTRLNWFWIEFVTRSVAENGVFKDLINGQKGNPKNQSLLVEISVQDVDKFYEGVIEQGLQPASEPQNFPWGRREFVLVDPDGYKLVFFQKKS